MYRPIVVAAQAASSVFKLIFESESESDESEFESDLLLTRLVMSRKRKRRSTARVPARVKLFVEITVAAYTDRQFREDFRLSRRSYERLLELLRPVLESSHETGRHRMNTEKQLLSAIWLLATPDSYRSVSRTFDMGKSSLFVAFYRVVKALNAIAPTIIRWPNAEEREMNEMKFRRMGQIPGVIGAVDGSYVPIKAPVEHPEVYINRKCFYGITLQAICDPDLKFLNCFAGYPSSCSDTRIFRNSPIFTKMNEQYDDYFDEQQFIIGDKAYPCVKFCIPPFIERWDVTATELNFNKKHAQTRQVIERSFALLFGRFRRLRYLDMNRTDLIPHTIVAACVLHNICLLDADNIDEYVHEGMAFLGSDTVPVNVRATAGSAAAADVSSAAAQLLRNYIAETLPRV